jgi:rhodanese-related sulfurtransferase
VTPDNILLGLVIAFVAWRVLGPLLARRRIPGLLAQGAQVVDVRSPAEFASGHSPGSINIPLQDLDEGAKQLDPSRWVIVCCASGTRSAIAGLRLRRRGFRHVLNAGPWYNLP